MALHQAAVARMDLFVRWSVEKAIAAYLNIYHQNARTRESFFRAAHRPASGRVSFAAYREYLTSRAKPRWRKIAPSTLAEVKRILQVWPVEKSLGYVKRSA
jgi:hypothetical protein